VIHAQVALSHQLFNVSVAERKPEIATDTKDDDRGFKLSSFEQRRSLSSHASQAYQIGSAALQHCLCTYFANALSDLLFKDRHCFFLC
jgi:hypothetical protein